MPTYYDILGVTTNAEPEVIRAAYRARMRLYHPDLSSLDKQQAEAKGVPSVAVLDTLKALNLSMSKKPLPDREVRQIARSVSRYRASSFSIRSKPSCLGWTATATSMCVSSCHD